MGETFSVSFGAMINMVSINVAVFCIMQHPDNKSIRSIILRLTANLVLESTMERIHHPSKPIYTDAYVGLFLIRGENVVLLGEVVCRFLSITSVTLEMTDRFTLLRFTQLGFGSRG
jgi:hypothetical protein